jgi:hypothetical protein
MLLGHSELRVTMDFCAHLRPRGTVYAPPLNPTFIVLANL